MPTKTEAVAALKRHAEANAPTDMRAAFATDPERFSRHSARLDDMLLDWSKCRVDGTTLAARPALIHPC